MVHFANPEGAPSGSPSDFAVKCRTWCLTNTFEGTNKPGLVPKENGEYGTHFRKLMAAPRNSSVIFRVTQRKTGPRTRNEVRRWGDRTRVHAQNRIARNDGVLLEPFSKHCAYPPKRWAAAPIAAAGYTHNLEICSS